LLGLAALVAGALVSAGSAPATTQDDREAKATADVFNLKSAIVQEQYAIHAIQLGTKDSTENAFDALYNSRKALAAVDVTASQILYFDPAWMNDIAWEDIKNDVGRAAYFYDPRALTYLRDNRPASEIVGTIEKALKYKEQALVEASALVKPPCTELLNLRGPFMVNGVAQGEPQLTISFDCTQAIKSLKIETPKATIDKCADPGHACGITQGSHVTVQTGESKDPSVSVQGPALAEGEEVIVEIKGDSMDYVVDDVM
jgi:hypothetical protein